jgi:hypothetical protein
MTTFYRLSRDVVAGFGAVPGYAATYEKGTPLVRVDGHFAIASEALVARKTHNAHDAKYRYVFVPPDAVEVVS